MQTAGIGWIRYLIITCIALLVSCAKISLPRPSAENPTLLVLPASMTNETNQNDHAFSFAYEIVGDSANGGVSPTRVEFTLPFRSGMVIVDSLPPGSYRVTKHMMLPKGAGSRTFGQRSVKLDLPFPLRAGQITIFDKSLNVRIYHMAPGRGTTSTLPMVGYEARQGKLFVDRREMPQTS